VAAEQAAEVDVRLYEVLFSAHDPADVEAGHSFVENLNPSSLRVVRAFVEPALAEATAGERFQFERLGYFSVDPDSAPGRPVFNRTVTLRDTWAKLAKRR
jgi:glutaminyl-tRNA synthetase